MRDLKAALCLYAITDRHWLRHRTLKEAVEQVIRGGATMIQLREKDLDPGAFRREALEIQELCRRHRIPFLINDNVALAKELDADGVHVGQSDMEAEHARREIGDGKLLGVSAETVQEALAAEKAGADYLGVGAVFPTPSKKDAAAVSPETLQEICRAVSIPVVAIGGISRENVATLKGTGIAGIAVISALFAQEDPEQAARELKKCVRDEVLA